MIHISFEFKDQAWGGANQFLKGLKSSLQKKGLYSEKANEAKAILFNSHHNFEIIQRLKTELPDKKFIHRVDGIMRLYNNPSDTRDDLVQWVNNFVADATIFQSEWSKSKLLEAKVCDEKPNVVIYNACDENIFYQKQVSSITSKTKIISTSYSNNFKKGFHFYKYLENVIDFEKYDYDFIGRSPVDFSKIQNLGVKSSKEVSEYLRNSDIYVTASTNDTCSNSLIEAISCGIPCLAFKSGGNTEIIEKTSSGLVFESDKDFLEKLDFINDNYKELVNNISPFKLDTIVDEYVNFIKSVINK